MLKPAQLRLLQAIAEQGQIQLAAEHVGMTQPAASRMLAEMERQLGAVLFLRQSRGLVPTEFGHVVLQRTNVILREMTSIVSDLQNLRDGLGGSIRIGSVTGPAVNYLVSAIREVKQIAPKANITVDVMPSRDLVTHLVAGDMDFVLARILPEFDSRDFEIIPMRDEEVSFLVRADHPLVRAPVVTLIELLGYEWIMQQRGSPIREATLAAFASLRVSEPENVVNSPSTLLTLAYLSQTDAIAPLSTEVTELLIKPPISARFAVLPVAHEVRVTPYCLLHLRRRQLSALALRLRESVIAQLSKDQSR